MKDLLFYMVKHLVDNPDDIRIEEEEGNDETRFKLYVASVDLGKVIGRGGRVARELRAILKTVGLRQSRQVFLEIME